MWAPPGSQWNQMPLDAASYQNVSHELVDWAALAQQWIQMKEAHENAVKNVPGMFHSNVGHSSVHGAGATFYPGFQPTENQVNGGEAPMDVEADDDHVSISSDVRWPLQNTNSHILPTSWLPQRPVRMGPPQQASAPVGLQTSFVNPQMVSPISLMPPVFVNPQVAQPNTGVGLPMIGAPHVLPLNSSKISSLPRLPLPLGQSQRESSDDDSNGFPNSVATSLDSVKRKNLPAWIKEGLEKMEREKQKRDDREKFLLERELHRKKQLMSENSHVNPAASRFDSEESEEDDLKNDDDESYCSLSKSQPIKTSTEDLVLIIRQLMTEVLLEVTTEEISASAAEAYQQAKVKSRRVHHSLPSKSLTQKLGLDQYGSDSEDNDDGSSPDESVGYLGDTRKLEIETQKDYALNSDCLTGSTLPRLTSNVKVETESPNVEQSGLAKGNGMDVSGEKATHQQGSKIGSSYSEKKSHISDGNVGKRQRSSSRDRKRSRSKDRYSRRSGADRSRSGRSSRSRSRSQSRRSSSRRKRRDSSKARKRLYRSDSKEKVNDRINTSREKSLSRNYR